MNSVSTPHQYITKSQINASELTAAFLSFQDQVSILSLDCFDTLIWRKTAAPHDVFIHLQNKPEFQMLGLSAISRTSTESRVRALKYIQSRNSEVQLHDIYRHLFPKLPAKQIETLIEEELTAESNICYAFPPVMELIRLAKKHNKKIMIVSDTYLSTSQLKFLLQQKLPHDVFIAIDDIFCSSELGKSKSSGLFNEIIPKLNINPRSILHIGDNNQADLSAPKALQINAFQLIQLENNLDQLANMRHWSMCMIDPNIRHTRPCIDPWRGLFSCKSLLSTTPEKIIGYMSLGPIMHAFAKFLAREISELAKSRSHIHTLFLMRDGYLSSKACEALLGNAFGQEIRISRFASYAASFRCKEDVELYLSENIFSKEYKMICRQLLLSADMTEYLISQANEKADSIAEFARLICQEDILQYILNQSQAYCQRLIVYLRKVTNFKNGDTFVFVDLGYRGTAQRKLAPIFLQEFNVEIIGRYLLALRESNAHSAPVGLIDATWCDDRALSMLVNYIALFEQMNTSIENSVIDYDQWGNPIFSETNLAKQQHERLCAIQSECIQFVIDAENYCEISNMKLSHVELRDIAIGELTRFLFLPTQDEIDYLQAFQFDFNLGTNKVINTFDVDKGENDLRQRGLFYMEKNINTMRTNYPAELRAAGLELSFTLMCQERFKGKINTQEMSFRREKLPIIIISGAESALHYLDAIPTFDGYYALHVPLNDQFHVAVQFGMNYRWVEILSVTLIQSGAYLTDQEAENSLDIKSKLVTNNMIERDNNLFECSSYSGLLAFMPIQKVNVTEFILRFVFRPIVKR